MFLRRVTAHLRDQHWTAIAIDFAIVVMGVFIGTQVSNLNAARIDRLIEADYLDRIVADLDAIAVGANERETLEQAKSRQVVEAMALTRQSPSDAKSLRLGNLLTLLSVRLSPNFDSSTFNDLQNSGRLALIHDPKLRNDLSAYAARLQYFRAAVRLNNDSYVETYVDFLRREGIGAGYAAPGTVGDLPLTEIEQRLTTNYRKRFGPLDLTAFSSVLRLPPSDPFWERLRANLSWRGTGSSANETLVVRIVNDARMMKREVERQRGSA